MKSALRILLLSFFVTAASAQTLSRDRWMTYAYEDMNDWLRRLPGIVTVDYGVAGAPLVLRPWGREPWMLGVSRNGIPWHRASDGLYESNLDSPEELDSLSVGHSSDGRLGMISMTTRTLPVDTPLTEISMREGYYGFGRVDFAHAQRLRPQVDVEGRGRLFWYDGLRSEISKSRFYNLSGQVTYRFSEAWHGSIEYGGANVDAQSPYIIRPQANLIQRPMEYSEREYGSARLTRHCERNALEFGAHVRQDRVTRERYFGLQEQIWYGYASSDWHSNAARVGTQLSAEQVRMSFPGIDRLEQLTPKLHLNGGWTFARIELGADGQISSTREEVRYGETKSFSQFGYHTRFASPDFATFRAVAEVSGGQASVPAFWRYAHYDVRNYPRFFDEVLADTSLSFRGRRTDATDEFFNWSAGVETNGRSWNASLTWQEHQGQAGRFAILDSTVWVTDSLANRDVRGISYQGYAKLAGPFSVQTVGSIQLDLHDTQIPTENRLFTRLIFSKDYFKSPLHIDAYAAYEHIGTRWAVSELGGRVLGPVHVLHVRIEATIEGVTLVWGAENLTAQHYEYLPGYMLIRKEEYFGLRWTLRL
ncbi:MAG: hypothetical protein IPG71_11470 [bacterium]|nr:hypothetical protein [bacterium]